MPCVRNSKIGEALHKAFRLGQTYWAQADSDSRAEHRRSDKTRQDFEDLIKETEEELQKLPEAEFYAQHSELNGYQYSDGGDLCVSRGMSEQYNMPLFTAEQLREIVMGVRK